MAHEFFGAAAEFVAKKYGGDMEDSTEVASVGTSVAEVLRNDPERVFALLVNLSANTIYIDYSQSVSSTRGIILTPLGGSYQVDVEEDFIIPTIALHAIATGANSTLYVVTMRRISKTRDVEA